MGVKFIFLFFYLNYLASPSAGALALKYGDVNTETTSPGEVKGLINEENIGRINLLLSCIKLL